ncbi:hypothetical protein K491DRAFT_78459 [Lophiostoma macrostomum CBS 122681]|uniref:Uncharacterized protein n=1 Tax=Lophiostoma macrostomum CBS 122681 TaxID=1314788 RepID=A0A6A6TP03_9PLEO|nr:hypothetical protein K491DRAFT_78459 [Lophiostoma macrostomum CBS 122681]
MWYNGTVDGVLRECIQDMDWSFCLPYSTQRIALPAALLHPALFTFAIQELEPHHPTNQPKHPGPPSETSQKHRCHPTVSSAQCQCRVLAPPAPREPRKKQKAKGQEPFSRAFCHGARQRSRSSTVWNGHGSGACPASAFVLRQPLRKAEATEEAMEKATKLPNHFQGYLH